MSKSNSNGIIVSYRADRFGARLTSLVNAKRVSDAYGIPFKVYWVQATDIGAVFNDPKEMFGSDFVDEHFLTESEWRKIRGKTARVGDFDDAASKQFLRKIGNGKDILFDMAFGIFSFKDEDPDQIRKDFVQAFNDIPKSPQLEKLFSEIGPKLSGATAYHIRRGDLVDVLKAKNRSWPKKFIPTEFFEYHMRNTLGKDTDVVLFSDEKNTIHLYKKQFPNAVSLADLLDDISLTEAGYDFLELYAMSHCAKIIAPAQSAFSAAAAELGNTEIVPLMEDFDAENYRKVYEGFIDKLEGPADPDFHQGDIGQCLVHAVEYLKSNGEAERAGNLMETWILRGLNIAHIYSSGILEQNQMGKYDSVLNIAEAADRGYVLFSKDKVIVDQTRAYAYLQNDDMVSARRHAQNAFWTEPMHNFNQSNVAAFYEAGIFDDSNAFPIEKELLNLDRRGGPARTLAQNYPLLARQTPQIPNANLPNLTPLLWDWVFFLKNQRGPKKQDSERVLSKIDKLRERSGDQIWMRSYEALLEATFGDTETAISQYQKIYTKSDDALTAFRCSHAYWQLRDFDEVVLWAERAVQSSDAPIYKVWLANVLTRKKRFEETELLLAAGVPPLDGFASVLEIEANYWQRVGNTKKVLEIYNRIAKLTPLSGYMRQKQAQAYLDLDQSDQALLAMKTVYDTEFATPKGFAMYVELLAENGDQAKALEVLELGKKRFPSSKNFDNLL